MIEPGVVVGDRYRVLRVLGEGGMGVVFEAEHTGVGRKVALKALHADYARSADIVERFQREARAAAAIGHDNIIDVIDFGMHDGAPYMVMEMLKGEPLDQRLARVGKLPLEHASYILAQVLSALSAAHLAGIVHRDLKPENVFLIQKAGMTDFVKLLDFGIAKLRTDATGADGKAKPMTQTGAVLGTPHYMAPEQALASRDLDARVDVYAAGVLLYEMATGTVPFEAESEAEILMEIAYQLHGIQPPSAREASLPREFDAIVLRALSKNRDDRFPDAGAFAFALAPFIATPPPAPNADVTARALAARATIAAAVEPEDTSPVSKATLIDGSPPSLAPPSAVERKRSQRSGRGWVMAAGATALIAGLAIAAGWSMRNRQGASVPSSAASIVGVEEPDVHVDLEDIPNNATVWLDGERTPERHLTVRHGSRHTLRVEAAGRETYTNDFVADRDRAIVIAMAPSFAAAPSQPVAPAPDAVQPSTAPTTATATAQPPVANPTPPIAHAPPAARSASTAHGPPTAHPSHVAPPVAQVPAPHEPTPNAASGDHTAHGANPLPVSNEF